jgi:hypothetical protein
VTKRAMARVATAIVKVTRMLGQGWYSNEEGNGNSEKGGGQQRGQWQ